MADDDDNKKKWAISLYSALLFFIIASPLLYGLVNQLTTKVAGLSILDANGCPNMYGVVLHTLVFFLIVRLSMEY